MSKFASQAEIDAEIAALYDLKDRIPPRTMFGDDNLASIDAQIQVLEADLDEDEIYDWWEDEEHTLDSALAAYRWMNEGEEEAPSEGWKGLVN